jgi:hypothetical protein
MEPHDDTPRMPYEHHNVMDEDDYLIKVDHPEESFYDHWIWLMRHDSH